MLLAREYLELMREFFAAGGYVLWAIFLASVLLWALIIERYVYLKLIYPRDLGQVVAAWRTRGDMTSWYAHKVRDAMVSELSLRLSRFLTFLRSLIAICPLLGLLGTVTGMINVFDVMAVQGSPNPRALAAGVSMATIPTMAGLMVALSGVFFTVRLRQQANLERQKAVDVLRNYSREQA